MTNKLYKVKSVSEVEDDLKLLECKYSQFNFEKDRVLKYLESKPEVYHINSNRRFVTVRDEIWDKFAKDRHSIGYPK